MSKRVERNQALSTSFRLIIPGFDGLNYHVQTVQLPGMSMSGVDSPYRNHQGAVPSDRIEYDPLNLTFLVDENYNNWDALRQWMINNTNEPKLNERMRDITLHILGSNKDPRAELVFRGAFPTLVSELALESSTGEPNPLMCNVTFRYQKYDFVRKDENRGHPCRD